MITHIRATKLTRYYVCGDRHEADVFADMFNAIAEQSPVDGLWIVKV